MSTKTKSHTGAGLPPSPFPEGLVPLSLLVTDSDAVFIRWWHEHLEALATALETRDAAEADASRLRVEMVEMMREMGDNFPPRIEL